MALANTEKIGFSTTNSPLQSSADAITYSFVGTLDLTVPIEDTVIVLSPSTTGNVSWFFFTILTKSLRYLVLGDCYMAGFGLMQSNEFSNS